MKDRKETGKKRNRKQGRNKTEERDRSREKKNRWK
jgi:hypothetical protein